MPATVPPSSPRRTGATLALAALLGGACALAAAADALPGEDNSLVGLPLEQLIEVEFFSASRTATTLLDTPASATILTRDTLVRSGADSLANALRLAPGAESMSVNRFRMAVGIRGLSYLLTGRVQVLVDGRSVYTPLFNAPYWNLIDLPFAEIDRIEVIRGSGATLWGSNAVNGVINIATRPASETVGTLLSVTAGAASEARAYLRHGLALGPRTHARVWLDARTVGPAGTAPYQDPNGFIAPAADSGRNSAGGLRLDHVTDAASWKFTAGFSDGAFSESIRIFDPLSLTALATTIQHAETSQAYAVASVDVDHGTFRSATRATFDYFDFEQDRIADEKRLTGSIDSQIDLPRGGRHAVIVGIGARTTTDDITQSGIVYADPPSRTLWQFTAFAQDTVTLVQDRWQLVAGILLEDPYFGPVQFQPQVRVIHTPSRDTAVWAAFARAMRTPARGEREGSLQFFASRVNGLPVRFITVPSPAFEAEETYTSEIGIRHRTSDRLNWSAVAYTNWIRGFRSVEAGPVLVAQRFPPYAIATYAVANNNDTFTNGLEFEVAWKPHRSWTLSADGTVIRERGFDSTDGLRDHTWTKHLNLRSGWEISRDWRFDTWLRLSDRRPNGFLSNRPGRFAHDLDARLAWKPRPGVELSLTGRNLLEPQRAEDVGDTILITPTEVERGLFGTVTVEF